MVHSAFSPLLLRVFASLLIMASQDYILQFSQGIRSTQPERSPSRTPRRDPPSTAYNTSVPAYRGPLHMATQQCRNPGFGYTHTWTPPRLPTMPPSTAPSPASWNYMIYHRRRPFSHFSLRHHQHIVLHRHLLRDPLHHNDLLQHHPSHPPSSMSQIHKGYPVRPCEIPAMPHCLEAPTVSLGHRFYKQDRDHASCRK